jgi:hypothetical protein
VWRGGEFTFALIPAFSPRRRGGNRVVWVSGWVGSYGGEGWFGREYLKLWRMSRIG